MANMNTHTMTKTYKTEGGTVNVSTESVEVDQSINLEREISAGATNVEFDVTVAVANIKGVAFGCTKLAGQLASSTVTLVIKTNSTTSPDETITITPENGYGWTLNEIDALLLLTDITQIFVSNTGTANAKFSGRFGVDSTPGEPG